MSSLTIGRSEHGSTAIITGEYSTTSNNDNWGTLADQKTDGRSYTDSSFTVGGEYETLAKSNSSTLAISADFTATAGRLGVNSADIGVVDSWGIMMSSLTIGRSEHDTTGAITGEYSTASNNDNWGTLKDQKTDGRSYTDSSFTVGGEYETLAKSSLSALTISAGFTATADRLGVTDANIGVVDLWGVMTSSLTIGRSEHGSTTTITGEYSTTSNNNEWGILTDQYTYGRSYTDSSFTISGEYETLAGCASTALTATASRLDISGDQGTVDSWGTITKSVTIGKSEHDIGGKITGEYVTTSDNNSWSVLQDQLTYGRSYIDNNKDSLGKDKFGVSGEYNTYA